MPAVRPKSLLPPLPLVSLVSPVRLRPVGGNQISYHSDDCPLSGRQVLSHAARILRPAPRRAAGTLEKQVRQIAMFGSVGSFTKGQSMPSPKIDKIALVINKRGNKKVFFSLVGTNFLPEETTLEIRRPGSTKPLEFWHSVEGALFDAMRAGLLAQVLGQGRSSGGAAGPRHRRSRFHSNQSRQSASAALKRRKSLSSTRIRIPTFSHC